MQNKITKTLDFTGHNIYVGLDVHKSSWAVNIMVDGMEHRGYTQPPSPEILHSYLVDNFPGAEYHSAYECGFCGYHHHRKLLELGINNIVINPADLPITDKEKNNKRDPLDSRRISHALQKNEINGIHVFDPAHEQFRTLSRMRNKAAGENRRVKNRIRSFLFYYGITPPQELNPENWTNAFVEWLRHLTLPTEAGTFSLQYLLNSYQSTRSQMLQVAKQLRHQVKIYYNDLYKRLMTVPGIGPANAICLIAEIGNMSRFKSYRQLASFVGLVPRVHQSGETDHPGSLTYRNNKYLLSALVESAWMALRYDPALMLYYKQRVSSHKSQVVICKVAHKLLNRIRRVWLSETDYQFRVT